MSSGPSRSPLIPLLAVTVWIAAFLAALSYVSGQREAAASAHTALRDCQRIAEDIEALRSVPAIVVPASRDPQDLAPLLETLAAKTSVGGKLVVSIEPQPPIGLPKSTFSLQSTDVHLQPLPLPELVTLLYAVVQAEPSVVPTALSLSPAAAPDTGEIRWSCQLVLTRLLDASITALPSPQRTSSRSRSLTPPRP